MMILLWILSAQPLVFALIFAFRARQRATRVEAQRRTARGASLSARYEKNIRPLAVE